MLGDDLGADAFLDAVHLFLKLLLELLQRATANEDVQIIHGTISILITAIWPIWGFGWCETPWKAKTTTL